MTKPLVSILVPAYNAERWIAETLRSALAQTWPHKEIIVVDDGSRDRTLEVARQFAGRGVRVVSQKNQGASATRNAAFQLSRGDYIQWLDADDLLSADKTSLQAERAEKLNDPRMLLSCGWGSFLYRYSRARFQPTPLWCDLSPAEWLLRKMSLNLHMQTATWLVSRELTEAAGAWNTTLRVDDDGEYFCRVLLASHGVSFVPGARVYYRASGAGSVSYIGQSDAKRESQWQSMQYHIAYLRSLEDSPRTRAACVTYLGSWLMFFDPERPELIGKIQLAARELGGELAMPRLPRKYSWLGWFGGKMGRRAQMVMPRLKWSVLRFCDRFLYMLERRESQAG
ncbi:MAG TPA: glycosyltransferase family 2 protein [Acidobacteriaceae bacterium]|jgi:glycosyltransferase involved in cell wall biosynthesis|nr:glycosyltransferase family 2 protein [Acidobacteriaceae bacterium]